MSDLREGGLGSDRGAVAAVMEAHESGLWLAHTTLEKREEDLGAWLREAGGDESNVALREEFMRRHEPWEVRESEGNMLVTVGINLMLDLLIGAGGQVFNNAAARLGVGDSSTAATQADTDLVAATNKLRKAMVATYPQRGTRSVDFRSDFLTAEANWAWNEWIVANAAASPSILNRKVESLGTKSSGTWTLTVTIGIS